MYLGKDKDINYLPKDPFLPGKYLNNTGGVFQMPHYFDANIYQDKSNTSTPKPEIHPLGMQFKVPNDVIQELRAHKVKGLFFVRQQRIPITYAQGLSVGIDSVSYIPMLYINREGKNNYYYESFLTEKRQLLIDFSRRWKTSESTQSNGLICLDAIVNPQLQAILDGSTFHLEAKCNTIIKQEGNTRQFYAHQQLKYPLNRTYSDSKLVYVPQECQLRYINKYGFSTKVGSSMEAKQFGFVGFKDNKADSHNFTRGTFTPFIGTQGRLLDSHVYSIKIPNYSDIYLEEYYQARIADTMPFYSVSPRFDILNEYIDKNGDMQYSDTDIKKGIGEDAAYTIFPEVYRGDCYTNTVTLRMHSNFIDADVPINDLIIDVNT